MLTKNEILEEIKQTTKRNNEKPLGYTVFQKETGIGWYEWGKYWAKWSDAVKEAGFKPNKPWTRVADKFLAEKMIDKIRLYGKYPSLSELRIEATKDSNFPYTTIKRRKKPLIVKSIIECCSQRSEYADVLEICKPLVKKLNEDEQSGNANATKRVGEVYLFKSGSYYKIGKTLDTVRRGKEIKLQLPEDPKLIHSIKTDDPSGIESYWHKRFTEKKKNGEWFKLNSDDIRAFKRWKKIC